MRFSVETVRSVRGLLILAAFAVTSACVTQEPLEQCEGGVNDLSRMSDVAPPPC